MLTDFELMQNESHAAGFLTEAIKDTQSTIRAVDTKVGVLLAALAIPASNAKGVLAELAPHGVRIGSIIGWLAVAFWLIGGVIAIRALIGIGRADPHVRMTERPSNVFYAGGLYRFSLIDAIAGRRSVVSSRSLETFVDDVPKGAKSIVEHLAFELLCLAYIRDLKIHRQKIAFECVVAAAILGLVAILFP